MHRSAFALALVIFLSGCTTVSQPLASEPDHFFVFLRRPAGAPVLDDATAAALQSAHMANIRRLYEEGHLVMAGPFLDDTALRGVFVFRTSDPSVARDWLASDPAVQAHRLAGDIHPFSASANAFAKPPADAKVVMDKYNVVIFAGTGVIPSALRSRHSAFVDDLDRSGKLAFAALFPDSDSTRAILILTTTAEEAAAIAAADPYARDGRLTVEIHPWMTQHGVLRR